MPEFRLHSDYFPLDNEFILLYWTEGEQYLYFTTYQGGPDGGDLFCDFGNGFGSLFRVDLDSGSLSRILVAQFYDFSPDGRKVAYASPGMAGVLDLVTGMDTYLERESRDMTVGDIVWSEDGTKLAYATCRYGDNTWTIVNSTIRTYSLTTNDLFTVIRVEGKRLDVYPSDMPWTLEIHESDLNSLTEEIYAYDWFNNNFIIPTPEP